MQPKLICEIYQCHKPAIGDFQRLREDLEEGWNQRMPIALCDEHKGKRIPVECNLVIRDGELKIWLRSIGKRSQNRKQKLRNVLIAKTAIKNKVNDKTASLATVHRRLKKGMPIKDAVKASNYFKKVVAFDKDGKKVGVFESIADCSRKLSIAEANINNVINGKRKTAGSLIFKYK